MTVIQNQTLDLLRKAEDNSQVYNNAVQSSSEISVQQTEFPVRPQQIPSRSNFSCSRNSISAVFQSLQNFVIGRTEWIPINLLHSKPAYIIVFYHLRMPFLDPGIKQRQVNQQIRVFVDHIHEYIPYPDGNGKLLPAFPDQGLILGLARFNLSAHKFPQ